MTGKLKKAIASLMAFATLSTCAVGVSASASTSPTTIPSVQLAPMNNGTWNYTSTRAKADNSKAYLYVVSGTCTPLVKICGTNSSSATGGANCTRNSSNTAVSYLSCSVGGTLYIKNNVRDKYNYANLGFQSSYSSMGGSVQVSWAPDSNVY